MTDGFHFIIHRFKQVDSTNSVAFRQSRDAPSGSVFVADYQTRGRGKWGRRWVSPRKKNLLFSLLLYPKVKASEAVGVTQIACRSVARVIGRRFRLKTTFKRPNDLLVKGKKLCGVLVEAKGRADGRLETLVIGVGLNVNASPRELAPGATSLWEETGRKQSRASLLNAILGEMKRDLRGFV
jgi:BirA family biotin operon repressor/biotin-[acetyl-CoA-carboxylase] ligase